ncbi:hypothetical protein DFJ73DRAFT_255198 [Zopfochytrium polystomum]|nr:hypothetical protein DFJ73DRAFT_255198 [Zopfochytrium polystomum]
MRTRLWWLIHGLDRFNLAKSSAASGAFFLAGDVIAQKAIEDAQEWNPNRTAAMAFFGLLWAGPIYLATFNALDNLIGASTTLRRAIAKALLSQLTVSPPYLSSVIFFGAAVRGDPPHTWRQTWGQRFPRLYAAAWSIWPAVNVVTFRYVPAGTARVVFVNGVGLAWTSYLATIGGGRGSG